MWSWGGRSSNGTQLVTMPGYLWGQATTNVNAGTIQALAEGVTWVKMYCPDTNINYTADATVHFLEEGKEYFVKNRGTEKFLTVKNASASTGANMVQWDFTGETNQKFRFTRNPLNGYISIINVNSGLYLGVENNSSSQDALIKQYYYDGNAYATGQRFAIDMTSNGAVKITPQSGASQQRVMAVGWYLLNSNGIDIKQRLYNDPNIPDYIDEWFITEGNTKVEIYFDEGYLQRNKRSYESNDDARTRLTGIIINDYYNTVREAFIQQCGIYYSLTLVEQKTSAADNCPNSGTSNLCTCISNADCTLQWSDNPNNNNTSNGFSKNCHHKSITRLHNDNIINLSDNTISISYTGHDHCFFSNNTHSINPLWGLADYDNPIVGLTIQESDQESNNVLVMAHEITHLYGIQHHTPNSKKCIMEEGVSLNTIDHTVYSNYWCDNCLNTLRNNRNKY